MTISDAGRRGLTILEMVMAMGIALIILIASAELFNAGRHGYERPRSVMSLQQELMQTARFLERDVAEASLQSLVLYPSASNMTEPPGMSMQSPRAQYTDDLVMGEFGVVRWQKYIYYSLDKTTNRLWRREGRLTDQPSPYDPGRRIPCPSPVRPSQVASSITERVLARHMTGFSVSWSSPFPEPVHVTLAVSEESSATGQTSVLNYQLQLKTRN